jgi:tetratricopeptide (TPR) repeat protein
MKGMIDKAKDKFTECLAIDNDNKTAALKLAKVLKKQGSFELSEKYYQYVLKLNDAYIPAHYGLAKLYLDKKSTREKAFEHIQFILEKDEKDYKALC